jgi:diguanylate cyclase (GGDEF)-like protein
MRPVGTPSLKRWPHETDETGMDTPLSSTGLDTLTGLYGRGLFFERAQVAFDDACAAGLECTAAVIDLDRLDFVNDTYGHHTGTELIRETGAALAAIAIEGDVIGRLGGDEFALLRPGGSTSTGQLWFEISTAAKHASGADKPFALAISVGVASTGAGEADSLDALMALADDAMYEHKQAGGGAQGPPHARRRARD